MSATPHGTLNRRHELWQLLVAGSVADLETEMKGSREDRPVDLVAGLFEKVAEEAPVALTDFLRRPTATIAVAALHHPGTLPVDVRAAAEEAGKILQMWAYSLVGALHRIPPAVSDKPFGGVVKFVRAVQLTLKDSTLHTSWPARHEFLVAVERCVRAARKWGIDGWTYRDRTVDLRPLTDFLVRQAKVRQSFDSRSLDALAYGARLHEQQHDIEAVAKENEWAGARAAPPVPGVTAWDMQIDDHHHDPSARPTDFFAAISWSHGTPEVYRLARRIPSREPTRSGWRLERLWPKERKFPDSPGRYSRGLTISRAHEDRSQPILVLARRADPAAHRARWERVDLVALQNPVTGESPELPGPLLNPVPSRRENDRCALSEDESVYSALDLEAGLVLLGLRGPNGKARLALLRIPTAEKAEVIELEKQLSPASPPGDAEVRNPVWSMATHRAGRDKSYHHVAIGCNDGSVWYLKVPRYANLGDRDAIKKIGRDALRVGVLGAAVWAVAIRTADLEPTHESGPRQRAPRVFGGGADGSVVAWQQAEKPDDWLPLWATRESSAIGRIHLFDQVSQGDSAASDVEGRHVLVLTHSGRAVVILDRPDIQAPTDDASVQLRVPGQRIDRVKLGLPVLTSDVLRVDFGDSPWPRILVASDDGRLRLVCPMHLRNTSEREDARRRVPMWPHSGDASTRADEHVATIRTRLHAAMATACDSIRLVPVEWVLKPRPAGAGLRPSTMPRYLSDLFVLADAWNDAYSAEETRYGATAKGRLELVTRLDTILRRCRRTHDPMLFREVVECVLRRMNEELVARADSLDDMPTARAIALGLIEVLKSIDGLWLGAADNMDAKLKIVQVKALLDSRVLLRLGKTDSRGGQKDLELLKARVDFVTSFLGREPLLTLEVFGAVNRTLLRCARHMRGQQTDVKSASSLEWEAIAPFFWRLKAVVARLAHPGTGLDDVLRHEAARAFALAVCCVPNRLLLLSHLLSEANLSFDMFKRVAEQLRALCELGIRVPHDAERLFSTATIWRPEDRRSEKIRERLLNPSDLCEITGCAPALVERKEIDHLNQWFPPRCPGEAKPRKRVESDNDDIVRQWAPWYHLIQELYNLAHSLELRPNRFSTDWLAAFAQALCDSDDPQDRFAETRDFWRTHLDLEGSGAWIRSAAAPRAAQTSQQALRPELLSVLAPRLETWCRGVIADVTDRQKDFKLFEPHASAYVAAVSRLLAVSVHLPQSAAVLSSIVVGVLNHGLLESLGETIFEFAEIARTLDPIHVARERPMSADPARRSPVPRAFASYLDRLRKKASGVPRTLRALKELLDSAALDDREIAIAHVFECHRAIHGEGREGGGWAVLRLEPPDAKVPVRTAQSLMLALAELHHNDREYGPDDRGYAGPTAEVVRDGKSLQIHVKSRLDKSRTKNIDRLEQIKATPKMISKPMPPSEDAKGLSHGTGLYMAKLALTLVRWNLEIAYVDRDEGTLITTLSGPSATQIGS